VKTLRLASRDTALAKKMFTDPHAIGFYRALGGEASPVTFFTFERSGRTSP
jgi:hypothetical protein